MKSVLMTFVIFIALFGLLKLDIAAIFDGYWFLTISLIILIAVITLAVFMFGAPTSDNFKKALQFKQKEVKNDKDK